MHNRLYIINPFPKKITPIYLLPILDTVLDIAQINYNCILINMEEVKYN